jgi:hypothetical protein
MKIQSPRETKKICDSKSRPNLGGARVLSRPTEKQCTLECLKKDIEVGGVVFKDE